MDSLSGQDRKHVPTLRSGECKATDMPMFVEHGGNDFFHFGVCEVWVFGVFGNLCHLYIILFVFLSS